MTVTGTTSEHLVKFNTNDDLLGITHTTGTSKIYVPSDGDYMVAVSAMVDETNNTAANFDVWFKINGANVPNSTTRVGINNQNLIVVLAVTVVLDMTKGQYMEVAYVGSTTNTRMLAVAAQASPTRPAAPSIILAITKVSA